MKHQISEKTWQLINQFFQEMPEAFEKLPMFKEILDSARQQSFQQGFQLMSWWKLISRYLQALNLKNVHKTEVILYITTLTH